jgi:hypothetical protein
MDEVKVNRVRRSESQWRELLARQAACGKPINRFCQEEGLVSRNRQLAGVLIRRADRAGRSAADWRRRFPSRAAA